MERRTFLQCIAAAAVTPACATPSHRFGALRPDPDQLLDLADGFEYSVVSRFGDTMSDGYRVPAAHDGMGAFARDDGRVALVCNHELIGAYLNATPFPDGIAGLPEDTLARIYDRGGDKTPALGGTTTTIWNPATRRTEQQFLSLFGTENNCAGGPTPWGSWLSCEEAFSSPGQTKQRGHEITRQQNHGYVFEVSAHAEGLVKAEPLRALGRFEHEAAAVDPKTGIVYLTEDRRYGLFYRLVPNVPGKLAKGGLLQALALDGRPSARTHNWSAQPDIALNRPLYAHWIDIEEPDPGENDLRLIYAREGATTFCRGEGLCVAGDRLVFTATEGGAARFGQVFSYKPTSANGGELELIAEATPESILRYGDNVVAAPWGDLILCEDRSDGAGLIGIRPNGELYRIARNSYSESELAGACFSPDGKTMFVNIQYPGMTVAITGPWPG